MNWYWKLEWHSVESIPRPWPNHQPKYAYLLYLCIIHYFIKLINKTDKKTNLSHNDRVKKEKNPGSVLLSVSTPIFKWFYSESKPILHLIFVETHYSSLWHHYLSHYLLLKAIFFISFTNLQVLFALDFLNLRQPPSLSLLCNSNSVQLWKYHLNSLNAFHVKSRV